MATSARCWSAVGWLTLAETLPKVVTKDIALREGYGEIGIRVIVPSDAPLGEYTVPATVEAEAVGTKLTTSGWITFTLVKPTLAVGTEMQTIMTYVFAALLLALVAYAYLKR